MSLDLGGPVLEVAIALAFVFFLLSLIVSAATEAIAWLFKRRAKTLVKGFERLLGTEGGIADTMLSHALVRSDITTGSAKKRRPSYVSPRNFALALVQVLREEGTQVVGAIQQVEAGVEAYAAKSPLLGAQLRALLEEAGSSVATFRTSAERWFDDGMDRVSGWYKRWSQAITIGVALIVAVGLNVDAVRIAERLAQEPTVRAAVVAQADAAIEKSAAPPKTAPVTSTGAKTEDAFKELKALNLPILWSEDNDNVTVNTVFGWLITILAISLGAPFWFDALGRLANLRTTGKKPAPEK